MKSIKESPDRITGNVRVNWGSKDARAFGYYRNELWGTGDGYKNTHPELVDKINLYYHQKKEKINLSYTSKADAKYLLKYSGRIWLEEKIISFWEYPKSKSEKMKVIKDLEKKYKVKILNDPEWLLEIGEENFETLLYFVTGKNITYAQWKSTMHVKMGNFDKIVPKGVGSEKIKNKLSQTQSFQKKYTSEEKLKNVIKQIIIKESPDNVYYNDEQLKPFNSGDVAFGYFYPVGEKFNSKKCKFYTVRGGRHHDMTNRILNAFTKDVVDYAKGKRTDDGSMRDAMIFPGRIWLGKKIISFWKYPSKKSEKMKVIKDLEKDLKIKILNDLEWLVEISEKTFETALHFITGKNITYAQWKSVQHVRAQDFTKTVPKVLAAKRKKTDYLKLNHFRKNIHQNKY